MARLTPTIEILNLRRRAESETHLAVRAARAQLERARAQLDQMRRRLLVADQALFQARTVAAAVPAETAAQLGCHADWQAYQAELSRRRREDLARATAEVKSSAQKLEQARAEWLACVARREAAELHDALERREQRRLRAQRAQGHEDEARERIAAARVK